MFYLKYAFKQKDKSIAKAILFGLILGFIASLTLIVGMIKISMTINSNKLAEEYSEKYGCEIKNYELSCNEDYYEFDDDIRIDLDYENDDPILGGEYIFTKDRMVMFSNEITYKGIFEGFGRTNPNMNFEEFKEFVQPLFIIIGIFSFVMSFVMNTAFYLIGNLLLALVLKLLINAQFKTNYDFQTMYKLSMYVVLPYVLFNTITTMIFGQTFTSFVVSIIPIFGFLFTILIDYSIIYGLTYLTIKQGLENQPNQTIVENEE